MAFPIQLTLTSELGQWNLFLGAPTFTLQQARLTLDNTSKQQVEQHLSLHQVTCPLSHRDWGENQKDK